ncbi:MAG: 2-keto-4-pentenoate hydratase [Rhizobiaceae bacterium]
MDVSKMAAEIVAARKSTVQTQMAWPDPAPTMEDAMAIQTAVFDLQGSPSVGWKVGATNKPAQDAFGIGSPFYGPMAESGVMETGASLAKSAVVGACEPEYAFKMLRNFPENGEEINAANATGAVDCLHIAIEVIGRTIGNPDYGNGIGVTMDFGGNVAFVVGPEVANWTEQDLASAPVESMVDGTVVQTGNGEPVMGDPINSLVWLAKTLAQSGQQIKAGEWVSTGTCTAAVPAQAGTTYSAKFSTFGEVSVIFS